MHSGGRLLASQQTQRKAEWYLSIFFRECTGADILTEEYLTQIREVENEIIALPGMKDFCFK